MPNKFHRTQDQLGKSGGDVNMPGKRPNPKFVEKARKIPGVPGKTQSDRYPGVKVKKVKTHVVSEGI